MPADISPSCRWKGSGTVCIHLKKTAGDNPYIAADPIFCKKRRVTSVMAESFLSGVKINPPQRQRQCSVYILFHVRKNLCPAWRQFRIPAVPYLKWILRWYFCRHRSFRSGHDTSGLYIKRNIFQSESRLVLI